MLFSKFILALLFVTLANSLAVSGSELSAQDKFQDDNEKWSSFLELLTGNRVTEVGSKSTDDPGLNVTIFPRLFPDFIRFDPMRIGDDINIFRREGLIQGTFEYSNTKIYGHSNSEEKLWYKINGLTVLLKYTLTIPSVTIDGSYKSDLSFFNGLTYFSGQGYYSTSFTNTTLTIEARVRYSAFPRPRRVIVDILDIGFRFGKLGLWAEDSLVNCLVPTWEEYGFDTGLFVETYFPFLSFRILTPLINNYLGNCALYLDGLSWECSSPTSEEPEVLISKLASEVEMSILSIVPSLVSEPRSAWVNPCTYYVPPIENPERPEIELPDGGEVEGTTQTGSASALSSIVSILTPIFIVTILGF